MTKLPYSYAVLQYRHDVWVGEALNVGVLLFSAKNRFLKFSSRTARGRIAKAYPDVDHSSFRETLTALERRFNKMAAQFGLFVPSSHAVEIGKSVLREDDSSFQWGYAGAGITDDLDGILERQYNRFVGKYDNEQAPAGRTDEMVFETVRQKLELASLYHLIQPHTVQSEYVPIEFNHALQNGKWHCIQPLSLDSADQERMFEKTVKWVGRLQSISSHASDIKPYFVMGAPQKTELIGQFHKMISLLQSSPLRPVVVEEHNADQVITEISQAVLD